MYKKLLVLLVLSIFTLISLGPIPDAAAQVAFLPTPGTMVNFSPKFNQATLKGIIFHPENPFKFDFILDEGDVQLSEAQAKAQSQKIAKYFLASLTTPEKEIWVNLSPYEKNRVIPSSFGKTLMGQSLLAQDYMLKQIMATALYPERQLGKEFWQKVYTQALIKFGTTNIKFNTFNKVWIVPDKAIVYENEKMNAVFVAQSTLKVLLDKDYLAENKNKIQTNQIPVLESVTSTMSEAVIKELVIPALEQEVNTGRNFAPLRQVYNALILAKWYKDNLRDNIIAKGYVDRNKIIGVKGHDKKLVSRIYNQYLKAYRRGVFNYIKEDFDEGSQSLVPRKYFSGGFMGAVNYAMTSKATSVRFKHHAWLARIALAIALINPVSSVVSPLLAQPAPPVYSALGTAKSYGAALTSEKRQELLGIISDAADGRGDPVAAAAALRQIPDTSTADYDAKILRLSPGGNWDQVLSTISSNATVTLQGGAVAIPAGIAQAFGAIISDFRARLNVGSSTLRFEAALDLLRKADQLEASGFWGNATGRGVFESVSNLKNEPSDTVTAARLLVEAMMIHSGNASRGFLGIGNNVVNLDEVFEKLQSLNWMVREAASAVFESIKPGDLDNKYQGMIEQFLSQEPRDMIVYGLMARVAVKQGMTTVLSNVARVTEERLLSTRSTDLVGSRNWNSQIQVLMQMTIALSQGNKEMLISNLGAMAGRLTNNATDTFNSYESGLMFMAVQQGALTLTDYSNYLANSRGTYAGLGNVQIQVNQPTGDVGNYLAQLQSGINPQVNVSKIVLEGGPIYFPNLLKIFERTHDPVVLEAIAGNLNRIFALGVNGSDNPWIDAINSRGNNEAEEMAILGGLNSFGEELDGIVSSLVRSVFMTPFPNLPGSAIKLPEGPINAKINTIAQVLAKYKGNLDKFIGPDAVYDTTGQIQPRFRAALLRAASSPHYVQTFTNGPQARSAGNHHPYTPAPFTGYSAGGAVSGANWEKAEKIFAAYLNGSNTSSANTVAAALEEATATYVNLSNPGSGQAIVDKYLANPTYNNPVPMQRMAEIFSKFKNKDLQLVMLSALLNRGYPEVDLTVLGYFKDPTAFSSSQREWAASKILDTYLGAFNRRDVKNPNTLFVEVQLRAAVIPALGDALKAARENKLNSGITDAQRRALKALDNLVDINAEDAYIHALLAVLDPGTLSQDLKSNLDNLARMKSPSTALDDLLPALKLSNFKNQEIRKSLFIAISEAQEQLVKSGYFDVGAVYESLAVPYLHEFLEAEDPLIRASALRLFLTAPPGTAADLFWKAINQLPGKYPDFANNEQQRKDLFSLLRTMVIFINQLNTNPTENNKSRFTAIVAHLQSELEKQSRAREFNNGLQVAFVEAIDKDLVKNIDFGIVPSADTHFLDPREIPYITLADGGKEIPAAYTLLASKLENIASQIKSIAPKPNTLEELENLFNPSSENPANQIAAIKNLGPLTLFFLPQIPAEGDVKTYLLYHVNQYQVYDNTSKLLIPYEKISEDWDRILYVGQLMKRGTHARDEARAFLKNDDLFQHHPEAINELVEEIGVLGGSDMVEPLLQMYVDRELRPYGVLGINVFDGSVIGPSIEEAVVKIGRRSPADVISRIQNFPLPVGYVNIVHNGPIFHFLEKAISTSNKAMISPTDGGIDLEKINVQSRGAGNVKTAFNDPAELAVMLKAGGLIPTIEQVEPMTRVAVNQLLGLL